MRDAVGNEINPGDEVIFLASYIRRLRVGIIMYMTPCGCRIMDAEWNEEINRPSGYIILKESNA